METGSALPTPTPAIPELVEADIGTGVVARLQRVVEAGGDRIAVSDERAELTYAQVAGLAAQVCAAVRGMPTLGAEAPVGLLGGHDSDAVAALMGIIASGHPVLVLDSHAPAARSRRLAEQVGLALVVTDEPHERAARELGVDVAVPLRDAEPVAAATLWADAPDPRAVAALAFTSGSTGTPKPVMNDHILLVQDAWNSAIATGCYDSSGVLAHTLPIAFHAGLTTTIHGLLVGATMRLYDARTRGIAPLAAFIGEHRCSVMITSPAILRAFCAAAPDPDDLATLTSVTVAGESAYRPDIDAVRHLIPPGCLVRNRYGSSETGLICEYVVGPGSGEVVGSGALPVGWGVGRTVVGLLPDDEAGGDGAGRVTVTALSVAMGYHQMAEATAASFHDNADGTRTYVTSDRGRFLPDGSLQLVGRVDHSVKVRGYLVDPGEVDAALFALPEVREAVVVGVPRPSGGARLVAYVVATDDGLDAEGVRGALRSVLPMHMVPEVLVFLPALPRSERGKIDRARLPEPREFEVDPTQAKMSHFEELVAEAWRSVLKVDHVGPHDDFFALGGDSLAAEALLAMIGHDLGVPSHRLHSGLLAEAPVLRAFAARVGSRSGRPHRSLVTLQTAGEAPPLFIVAGAGGLGMAHMGLARRMGGQRPVYALQSPVIEARGLPERSVKQIARRHVRMVRRLHPRARITWPDTPSVGSWPSRWRTS